MATRVAIFGVGYVGCVTGACLARDGHSVVGVDVDEAKVRDLGSGIAPVAEPGLSELVAEQVKQRRLTATVDVDAAVRDTELALIAVGTPSSKDGAVSTSAVKSVVEAIGQALCRAPKNYVVVIRSTLLPGILEQELAPALEQASGQTIGGMLQLGNNPEFLRESSAIHDYDHPPFVIAGTMDNWDAQAVLGLYEGIDAPRIVVDTRTAAMVKYGCNAFHALKVAFANEIGAIAKSFGGDGQRVMEILCNDTKLNVSRAYLRPGFAFGGSCLPKDLRAMVRHAERDAVRVPLLTSILPSNQEHLRRAFDMIEEAGGRSVGLVGLSFKAGTDDLRESPFVALAEMLVGRGFDLKVFDPGINVSRLKGRNQAYVDQHLPHLAKLLVDSPVELVENADIVVLGTAIADNVEWREMFAGPIVDLRNDLVRTGPELCAMEKSRSC